MSILFAAFMVIVPRPGMPQDAPSGPASPRDTACEAPLPPPGDTTFAGMGPLSQDAGNPRYFSDPGGRVVFLAGSHTWNNVVDMDDDYPPDSFDYDRYLTFLTQQGHSFTRIWAWETARPDDRERYPYRVVASPFPWLRTGPGEDVTGLPKFDLTRFNDAYFERLRNRVVAAGERGLYVAVMFFEGWSVQFSPGAMSHPFLAPNNVNELGVTDPLQLHTLKHPGVTAVQKAYVRRVVRTLADLGNVIYEIVNSAHTESSAWQYEMIRFVHCLESGLDVPHPVGMTNQYRGGRNETLLSSPARWIAPGWDTGHYVTAPLPADGEKVIVIDTDHLGGSGFKDVMVAWKGLFRGMNLLYMDRYVGEDSVAGDTDQLVPARFRKALGSARLIADFIDIGKFTPSMVASSTSYALVADDAVLVFLPDPTQRLITVDLGDRPTEFAVDWLQIREMSYAVGEPVRGGRSVSFLSPFSERSVLLLRRPDAASLAEIVPDLEAVQSAAMSNVALPARLRWRLEPVLQYLARSGRATAVTLVVTFLLGSLAGIFLVRIFRNRRS